MAPLKKASKIMKADADKIIKPNASDRRVRKIFAAANAVNGVQNQKNLDSLISAVTVPKERSNLRGNSSARIDS